MACIPQTTHCQLIAAPNVLIGCPCPARQAEHQTPRDARRITAAAARYGAGSPTSRAADTLHTALAAAAGSRTGSSFDRSEDAQHDTSARTLLLRRIAHCFDAGSAQPLSGTVGAAQPSHCPKSGMRRAFMVISRDTDAVTARLKCHHRSHRIPRCPVDVAFTVPATERTRNGALLYFRRPCARGVVLVLNFCRRRAVVRDTNLKITA